MREHGVDLARVRGQVGLGHDVVAVVAGDVVQQLFEILDQIARDAGVSMLLVEQNYNLALKLASNAALLEVGNLVARGTAKELSENQEIARAYLGDVTAEEAKA